MLPTDPKERKATPIYSGVVKYFPLALAEVARVSKAGNDQHNPGQPLHWDKSKSTDHLDCIMRHIADAGTMDNDGQRHTAKVAWRALAALEMELEGGMTQQMMDSVCVHERRTRHGHCCYTCDADFNPPWLPDVELCPPQVSE